MVRGTAERGALQLNEPFRHLRAGVSTTALALAWARRESAPEGATVVVDHEVSPLGWRGALWEVDSGRTLSLAVVLRPRLPLDESDLLWAMAADVVAAFVSSPASPARTRWPDRVVGPQGQALAMVKLDIVAGAGGIAAATAAVRVDLQSSALDPADRTGPAQSLAAALVSGSVRAAEDPAGAAKSYTARSATVGRLVRAVLLPRGEARGRADSIDPAGRLVLVSPSGLVEPLTLDLVSRLEDYGAP